MIHISSRAKCALATTCLTPVAVAFPVMPAVAAVIVDEETTTPLQTSIAGDITLKDGGSIDLDGGVAIVVDSNSSVTAEEGSEINVEGADGAAGIVVVAGTSATISNDGTISVTEDFTAADDDENGIADGPIAEATDRYGIHVTSGASTSGSIANSGTITVEGLNSGGIVIDAPYAGSVTNSGTISVSGDHSVGIRTQDVSGDVTVEGAVNVVGEGAQGVVLDGDIGGTFHIQGNITQASSYTTDEGTTQILSRSDLRSGAPAVSVNGNVDGGIIVAAPPYDRDTENDDEDRDDITDDEEGTGSITAFGNSPGLLIGSADDIVIGTVQGRDGAFSLVVDGMVSANSVNSATDAFGIVIGGQGGTTNLPGGIGISGSVSAVTYDSSATALLINEGATVPNLYNSGAISATISAPGEGSSYAILDLSGTLAQIDNTGSISVSGSSEDRLAAIDVSANTSGVTISQYLNDIDQDAQDDERASSDYDADNAIVYTSIQGDILTGSGNDLLDIRSGSVDGDSYLNAGDDGVLLSNDSRYDGDIHFGSGTATMAMSGSSTFSGTLDAAGQPATLTITDDAAFTGAVAGGENLSVNVAGGHFGAGEATVLHFDSLTVGSTGTLDIYIDGETGTSSTIDVNNATFESGASISATISSLANAEGSYTVLTADSLNGTPAFDASTTDLPVLFNGEVSVTGNDVILDVSRKTAEELGLTRSQAQGYESIYAAALNDDMLGSSLLEADDVAHLKGQFDQLLPDHAGGVFDVVTRGARLATRHLTDDDSLFDITDLGGWLEPFLFRGSKDASETAGFKTSGWGISSGLERVTTLGNIGLSFAYIAGDVTTGDWQTVKVSDLEVGAFWRFGDGPFYAFAKLAGGYVSASSSRSFTGRVDGSDFAYGTASDWKGWTASGTAGASYSLGIGGNFRLKPMALVEYYRLHENAHQEDGAEAIDLAVDARNSSSLSATTTIMIGWSADSDRRDARPFTIELEGGRRTQIGGHLGSTTAAFVDGEKFSVTPDSLKGGWVTEARIFQGGLDYTWKLAAGAERTQGNIDYSLRGSLSVAF